MEKCPKCGKKLAPIVYGLPTSEAAEASSRGEIFLGGCEVHPNSPKYHCYNCILDFDKDAFYVIEDIRTRSRGVFPKSQNLLRRWRPGK